MSNTVLSVVFVRIALLSQTKDLCLQADTTQQRKSRAGVFNTSLQIYTQPLISFLYFFSQLEGFPEPDVVCLFYNPLWIFNPSIFPISL